MWKKSSQPRSASSKRDPGAQLRKNPGFGWSSASGCIQSHFGGGFSPRDNDAVFCGPVEMLPLPLVSGPPWEEPAERARLNLRGAVHNTSLQNRFVMFRARASAAPMPREESPADH